MEMPKYSNEEIQDIGNNIAGILMAIVESTRQNNYTVDAYINGGGMDDDVAAIMKVFGIETDQAE